MLAVEKCFSNITFAAWKAFGHVITVSSFYPINFSRIDNTIFFYIYYQWSNNVMSNKKEVQTKSLTNVFLFKADTEKIQKISPPNR